jgi:glycosyltransferase involved in cell wall biosynthesis
MDNKVTVIIPVGPNPAYKKWLPEAVESVLKQSVQVDELFILDDGANLSIPDCCRLIDEPGYAEDCYYKPFYNVPYFNCSGYTESMIRQRGGKGWWKVSGRHEDRELHLSYWRSPCRLGVAAIFNVGVALANNNLVFMLGSDDVLKPTCIEECAKAYEKHKIEGWYSVTVETPDGEKHSIPNHAAMVTKKLFEWFEQGNGYYGFPASAGVGGPDALLLSILLKHSPGAIIQVKKKTPLYWVREHEHQMTKQDAAFFHDEVISVRGKETNRFEPRKYDV